MPKKTQQVRCPLNVAPRYHMWAKDTLINTHNRSKRRKVARGHKEKKQHFQRLRPRTTCTELSQQAPMLHIVVPHHSPVVLCDYSGKRDYEMSESLHCTLPAPNNFTCFSTPIAGSPSAKCQAHHTMLPCTRALSDHSSTDPSDANNAKTDGDNHATQKG